MDPLAVLIFFAWLLLVGLVFRILFHDKAQ